MTTPLADQAARDLIRTSLSETLVVEAAAGTGKTTELVSRIVEVIKTGRGELQGLVAVTFTEKAAGELKLRLRGELEKARGAHRDAGDTEATERLETGLAQLEEAHLGTIHGFCADLLKEHPLQAGVDPLFEVATEEDQQRLYRRVFDRWLEEKLADPPPGVRRLLRRGAIRDKGPVDDLYQAGLRLLDIRDFPAPWQVRELDRDGEIDDLVERLFRLAEMADQPFNERDKLYEGFGDLFALVQDLRSHEQVSGRRDYDALEQRLPALKLGWLRGRGPYGDGASREELLAEREALKETLADFRKRAGADLAAHLQNELREVVDRYQSLKEKRGRLDFLDLLARARDLLRDDDTLRRELQQRFTHVFVDEFQDTDPLQAEILLLLSSKDPNETDWRNVEPVPGKLFVVADPKQSIYRFRRADVALYQRIKDQLLQVGAEAVYLTVSFRAVPELQELVNVAMSEEMKPTKTNHQADYVPLDAHREPIPDQPSIIALSIPHPYGDWGNLTQYAMRNSEPGAVAAWVKWLLDESGWNVTSRGSSEPRPVRPSDVCLLFRRFVYGQFSVTQPYVDALQALDVPHVLVGGRGFHQREEVEAMRLALTALERPDDELAVFATLRGPLFGLSDDSLFLYRSRHRSLHPFRKHDDQPPTASEKSICDALDVLARLHKGRNHRPIALTLRELLDATRAQAGFALWQSGDQVLANVVRLMQIARDFERSGGLSFRGFVNLLEMQAEQGHQYDQPIIEDGVEGVRLMTVHRAKGLEFPVVVLCDITCSLSMGASRHIDPDKKLFAIRFAGSSPWELLDHEETESDRDAAESLRLLYVAATRARDVLAIPTVADEPHRRGWVGPLLPAMYPPAQAYRLPMVAPGCPRFTGDDCVIERPWKSPIPPGEGLRPGMHKPAKGGHHVVWWDPLLFVEQSVTKPGIRRHWILQAEASGENPGSEEYASWLARREETIEQASLPTHEVTTATRLAEEKTQPPEALKKVGREVRVELVAERSLERPTGKRFGALVHELMARSRLEATREELEELARSLGRVLDNSDEEIRAAAEVSARALSHPLLERARAAAERGCCFRETPLLHRAADDCLIEAIPDLVFQDDDSEGAGWTIVDFKTDLRVDMSEGPYRLQVATYMQALTDTGRTPVTGVLLYL